MASLPGLRHAQALNLNLTGSLVSNLLPFGGAAGVANTYGLTFSWGSGSCDFVDGAGERQQISSSESSCLVVGLVVLMSSDATLPVGASGVLRSTPVGFLAVLAVPRHSHPRQFTGRRLGGDGRRRILRAGARLLRRPQPKPRLRPR